MRRLLALPLLFATLAHAQTAQQPNWFKIASEGDQIVTGPASTVMQACADATHCSGIGIVTLANYPLTISWSNAPAEGIPLFGHDPESGVVKAVGVVETCAVQTFIIAPAGTSAQMTVTVPAATTGCTPATPARTEVDTSNSAIVVNSGPQISLTLDETTQLQQAIYKAKLLKQDADAAMQTMLKLEAAIVTAHSLDPAKPFQLVFDSSWTFTYTPPMPAQTQVVVPK